MNRPDLLVGSFVRWLVAARGPSLHYLVTFWLLYKKHVALPYISWLSHQKTRGPPLHWLVVAPNNTWPFPARPAARPKRSKG